MLDFLIGTAKTDGWTGTQINATETTGESSDSLTWIHVGNTYVIVHFTPQPQKERQNERALLLHLFVRFCPGLV